MSPVFNLDEHDWYAVSLLVPRERLLEAVDHLRDSGAKDIAASQVSYLFKDECGSFRSLLESGRCLTFLRTYNWPKRLQPGCTIRYSGPTREPSCSEPPHPTYGRWQSGPGNVHTLLRYRWKR